MDSFLAKLGFIIPEKAFSSTFHAHHDSDVVASTIHVDDSRDDIQGVYTRRDLTYTHLNIVVIASMVQEDVQFPAGKIIIQVIYGTDATYNHEVRVEEEFDIINDPAYAHYD